ncbi:hypothetical protein B296_00001190 [Ensete ventricosum]|uniref:Uncharacterized protein n=1 Tax=Ensete ventricosum TaxID=4639 RepID=A0A426ZKM2_ENSVE|nr:hypothetical protein B296_00001190 [Ensete ventricosum]
MSPVNLSEAHAKDPMVVPNGDSTDEIRGNLSRRGYYDNVKFHRIIKSSMWSRILSCKVEIRRGLEGVVNPSTG